MKRFQTDVRFGNSGTNLGIAMLPFINLTIVIPAVIITKTTARATDKADVYLSESAKTNGCKDSPHGKAQH